VQSELLCNFVLEMGNIKDGEIHFPHC
jgi:hypothetical protein